MPEIQKKKTSAATVAGIALLAAAVIAMAVYLIFIVSPGKTADEPGVSASAPEFSAPESSEPEEISAELKTTLAEAEVGNLVRYGKFIQDQEYYGNEEPAEVTPIEWIVLDKQEGKLLLLSYRCLAIWQFDGSRGSGKTAFAESGLFKRLNESFYATAFSDGERSFILGDEGKKVFILNAEQAEQYLNPESHRIAKATHTAASSIGKSAENPIEWWLADVTGEGFAAYVYTDGSIRLKGFAFDYDEVGVRPAIWVSTDAEAE